MSDTSRRGRQEGRRPPGGLTRPARRDATQPVCSHATHSESAATSGKSKISNVSLQGELLLDASLARHHLQVGDQSSPGKTPRHPLLGL